MDPGLPLLTDYVRPQVSSSLISVPSGAEGEWGAAATAARSQCLRPLSNSRVSPDGLAESTPHSHLVIVPPKCISHHVTSLPPKLGRNKHLEVPWPLSLAVWPFLVAGRSGGQARLGLHALPAGPPYHLQSTQLSQRLRWATVELGSDHIECTEVLMRIGHPDSCP